MSHASAATLHGRAAGHRSLPRPVAFWLVALATMTLTAASAAPSPLYPVYQAEYKFSEITLTMIFAVYVFALIMSLLTVGRLSDYVGRRPLLAGALIVEAGAMAVFVAADGVGWLLWARIVQGFATGAAVGALAAYLLDLQPSDGSRLGSLVNSVAPTFGLGLGAIVTGLLVQYAPHPTRLVFVILMALFAALVLATVVLPETVPRVPGGVAAMRPEIAVPTRARRAFAGAVPTMVSTWALGGLVLSVGGSLLGAVFGQTNDAVIGLVIGLFPVSAASAAMLARGMSPPAMARLGSAVLAIGAGLFLLALGWSSMSLFVMASIVSGAGFGSGFLGSLRAVSQLAEPYERAALLSAVYVVSYLAFSLPALVAGVVITSVGLRDTSFGYGGFVALVAVATLLVEQLIVRRRLTAIGDLSRADRTWVLLAEAPDGGWGLAGHTNTQLGAGPGRPLAARQRADPNWGLRNTTEQKGIHMPTITTRDDAESAHRDGPYSGLPNKLVRAANGIDYAYRDNGPGANGAPPLVLLQHFRGNLDNWDPALIDALGPARRIVTFDNAGVGGSTGTTPNTVELMAHDAIAFVAAMEFGQVDVLGFSIGSFVAQQIALTRPAIVRRLVLASAAPQGAADMHGWAPEVIGAIGTPETRPEEYLEVFFTRSSSSRQAGQEVLRRIYARAQDRDTATTWATREAQYEAVCTWGIPNHALLQRLSCLKMPVFVANGDSDRMIPPNYSYLLAGLISQARVKIYPDSAHGFLFQHHAEFAADVEAFLNDPR